MKRSSVKMWMVLAAFLAAYHAVAFLIPFPRGLVFWLSYLFTLAAFAVVTVSLVIAFKKPDARSRFYGFPIARIGFVYWVTQLAVGIALMALGEAAPWWLAVLVQVLSLAAALVGLVAADTAVQEIYTQEEKIQKSVSLMRMLRSKAGQLAAQCGDTDTAGAVTAFAEELRYSDPVSNAAAADAEAELSALVDELQQAVAEGDTQSARKLCRRASDALAERNRLCKLGK